MTFAQFKANPIAPRQILVQFGTSDVHSFFVNYEPGIWRYDYYVSMQADCAYEIGSFCYGAYEGAIDGVVSNGKPSASIISVIVDGSTFTSVSTLTNLRATNKSFMWDPVGVLYVHFDAFDPPWAFSVILLGIQVNVALKAGMYGGNFYESRLHQMGAITARVDPLFYGVLSFGGLDIDIKNQDGVFDHLASFDLYGQTVNVLYGAEESDIADFKPQFNGIIDQFMLSYDLLSLKVRDRRKIMRKSVPINLFTLTAYPYLDPDNANKPIPMLWGECFNVPVMCTNDTEPAPSAYHFKVCDTAKRAIKAIDAVRVDGAAKTPSNVNLTNATFDLSTSDYAPGQDVTVDARGYVDGSSNLIENGLQIIRYMLVDFLDFSYTTDNYDTTEWAAAEALAREVDLFVNDVVGVDDVLGRLCTSLDGVMFPKANGKITFRYVHRPVSVIETVRKEEFLGAPKLTFSGEKTIGTVDVLYKNNWANNETLVHRSVMATSPLSFFWVGIVHTMETLLHDLAYAQELAAWVLAEYAQVPKLIEVPVPVAHVELEPLDDVTIYLDRFSKEWLGAVVTRVYGVSRDLMRDKVTLTLRGAA